MTYGTIKVDTVTFTDGGVDKSVSISGLVQNPTFSGNITVTGTVSGNTIQGQTVSGVTVTGTTALFSTGTFISLTGTTSQGTTATYTSGSFTSLTGVTTSGTTANFVSGVFSTQISGATVTGNAGAFTTLTGGVTTITSGVFAAGSATNPSISFSSDTNTGIYSPGADQVAISTGGSGRLFVDASGRVGINSAPSLWLLEVKQDSASSAGGAYPVIQVNNPNANGYAGVYLNDSTAQAGLETQRNTGHLGLQAGGSERLRITSAGLVGIGTSSPDANSQLHIVGSSYQPLYVNTTGVGGGGATFFRSGTQALYVGTAGSSWLSGSSTADGLVRAEANLVLATNGNSHAVTIDTSQRVGIGTTSPRQALTFGGLTSSSTSTPDCIDLGATYTSTSASTNLKFKLYVDSSGNTYGFTVNGSSHLEYYAGTVSSPGNHVFLTGGTERARIDSSGRLLVGTSSGKTVGAGQYSLLNVQGYVGASNGGGDITLSRGETASNIITGEVLGFISFTDSAGYAFAQFYCEADGDAGTNDYPGRLVFTTTADGASSPTERMRIDNAGILKVSNNSTYAAGGYHQFNQNASSQWTLGVLGRNAVDPYGIRVEYTNAAPNGTVSQFLYCVDTAGVKAEIRSNGGLANYSANNANLSDRNAKKDISPAADTWDCIKEWEIVNYRYKDQPGDADLNLGVIAQQVAKSCPEVITVFEEAKNGQPEKLGVKEQQMYWMAIKALQEAQVRIETLEAKVAALETA